MSDTGSAHDSKGVATRPARPMLRGTLGAIAVALGAGVVAAPLLGQTAAAPPPLTPEAVLTLKKVSDPQISPSGARVAFVVTGFDDARVERNKVWTVGADGAGLAQVSPGGGTESAPRWSPDERSLAFVSRAEGAGDSEIRLIPLADRSPGTVPGSAGAVDFAWSPDGRSLALRRSDPVPPEEQARKARGEDERIVGEFPWHVGLWLLDPKTGAGRRLSAPGETVWSYSWSPKGDAIAALVSSDPRAEGLEYGSSLVVIDVAKGGERVLTKRTNPHAAPAFSPDGTRIVYLGPVGDFKERGTIQIVPAAGGEPRTLLADYPGNVWDVRWRPDRPVLIAAIARGVEHVLAEVTTAGEVRDLVVMHHAMTPYWDRFWSVSRDGSRIAFVSEKDSADTELWVAGGDGSGAHRLTSFNENLEKYALGAVSAVRWTNPRDNAHVEGVLVTPAGLPAGAKAPLIAWLHGGPAYNWGLASQVRSWAQLLASHGYAVLLPNFRGSSGYGMKWLTATGRAWGDGPLSDVMSGVDSLVARGLADPARLFVGGGSYGGYLTLWAIGHTTAFKAAFIRAGVADLAEEFATTDEPTFEVGYFKSTPYDDPEFYRKGSPLEYAGKVTTPLLIVHGERDLRVPLPQGLEYWSALRHYGVPVEMIVYPREGHGIREYAHQIDVMNRMLAWYARWDGKGPASDAGRPRSGRRE